MMLYPTAHEMLLWAFQGAEGAADAGGPGLGSMAFPLVAIGLLFYFMVFLPQRRQSKDREGMIGSLKKGDHVVTIGGVHGVVANVKEETVVLKVDESRDVTIEFSKTAIAQVPRPRGGKPEEAKGK